MKLILRVLRLIKSQFKLFLQKSSYPKITISSGALSMKSIFQLIKSQFKLFLLLLITIATLIGYFYYHSYQQQTIEYISLPSTQPEDAIFEIKKGSNINQIANKLAKKDIIPSAINFKLLARLHNQSHKLKAGEYKLSEKMTIKALLDLFVSGKTLQYKLSIIEGKTFANLKKEIRQHPSLKQTLSDDDYKNIIQKLETSLKNQAKHKLKSLANNYSVNTKNLANMKNPEGWFYPDTYNFPRKTTDLQFLQRAYQKMQNYLHQAWQDREKNSLLKTPYDALILASIVEKETGIPEERALIAGVFLNRLKIDMLLQTDPTVIYGMGEDYTGTIYKSDLKRDTAYNTYTRKGLTPTPIATPSLEAIQAVLHPQKTEAFYFVADGTGGHDFSETYEQHKQAVGRYRALEK